MVASREEDEGTQVHLRQPRAGRDGGYVLLRWHCKGQPDDLHVWYLDRFRSYVRGLSGLSDSAMSLRRLADIAGIRQHAALYPDQAA